MEAIEIDLTKVVVEVDEGHDNRIIIDDKKQVGIVLSYPSVALFKSANLIGNDVKAVFDLIVQCVDHIFEGEKIYPAKDMKEAEITQFLDDLPQGLNTNVGNKGVKLSGGQLQRVGIARALYNKPSVIIMDEGTNSLDNETEKEVIDAIKSLKIDHTLIIIAHDLQTIKDAFSEHKVKYELYAKHLYYDREEITVHARLLSPAPIMLTE